MTNTPASLTLRLLTMAGTAARLELERVLTLAGIRKVRREEALALQPAHPEGHGRVVRAQPESADELPQSERLSQSSRRTRPARGSSASPVASRRVR